MDKKSNILIVEDHALTVFALKASLSNAEFIDEIFDVADAKSAYQILKEQKIDLILMDLGLPEINGVEAIETIRKKYNDVKILVLTSHCDKDEVTKCLQYSISAYCTKDIKPDKLINIIKDVLEGSMYFDSAISKYVMQNASEKTNNKFEKISVKDCYNLTQQEKRVLILLAGGNSNLQIARKLSVSVNTIKVHVCAILQKMQVEDRTQAAIKAIRENLIN